MRAPGLLLAVVLVVSPAAALDHKNLDAGRPTRLADAYTISVGEIAVEAGAGLSLSRSDDARGAFPVELLWGAVPNLQIGIGTTLSTDPRTIDEPEKSGDVGLSALYNVNQETLWLPAFGAGLELNLPTGVRSSGVDVGLTGILTKSIERLSLHLDAGYTFLSEDDRDARDGHWALVLGASYPIGAPHHTRTTLIADVFAEQAPHRGAPETVGAEVGIRYQLTPRFVWDVGVGTELAGPSERSRLFFTTGLSFGF